MFSFQMNAETLPPSEAFLYLGRIIVYNNSDWVVVYQNLRKARMRWIMILRVLERTGATVRARGSMYKAVASWWSCTAARSGWWRGRCLRSWRVPPLGGATDHRDDVKTQGRRWVVVPLSSGGNERRGYLPHRGVPQEVAGNHSVKGGLPPHIWAVHGGGEDSGEETVGTMVGLRRGKLTWRVDKYMV